MVGPLEYGDVLRGPLCVTCVVWDFLYVCYDCLAVFLEYRQLQGICIGSCATHVKVGYFIIFGSISRLSCLSVFAL